MHQHCRLNLLPNVFVQKTQSSELSYSLVVTHASDESGVGYEAFRALDIRQRGAPRNTVSYRSHELFSSGTHVLPSFTSL